VTDFIDPRSNPEPPPLVSREPAAHGDALRELLHLCSAAQIYDVERWIQEGRPIQALTYKRPKRAAVISPLRAAIRRKQSDLVLLFLCNGYRMDLEVDAAGSVLDEALRIRAFEILELLLKWGADPVRVSAEEVVDTYRTDLIERFWQAGVDYTADSEVISYLAHTVNKPLYGWLRQHRSDQRVQDALDIALLEAVDRDEELPARLLLWAGANPHRKVPMLRDMGQPDAWMEAAFYSSAEAAIAFGRHRLLDHLRIKEMPELDDQAASAHDTWMLKKLVTLKPPWDWSPVILAFIRRFCSRYGSSSSWDAREALRFIASSGGKLTTVPPGELRYLRSHLLEVSSADDFNWLLKWLRNPKNCEAALFVELMRTPAVKRKLEAAATGAACLSPSQKMSRANDRRQRARLRAQKSVSSSED
jgi:hypothetical protein